MDGCRRLLRRTSPDTPAQPASQAPPDPPPSTRPTTSLPLRRAPSDIGATTTSLPPPSGSHHRQASSLPGPLIPRFTERASSEYRLPAEPEQPPWTTPFKTPTPSGFPILPYS